MEVKRGQKKKSKSRLKKGKKVPKEGLEKNKTKKFRKGA